MAVHIGAMLGFGPFAVSAPRPGMFETIEVALLAEPAANPAPKASAASASISNSIAREIPYLTETGAGQPDAETTAVPESAEIAGSEPLIESRYDVATLNNPKPPYPLVARRHGAQGRVILSVQVSASGMSHEVLLKRSSGHAVLDDAALQTVRRWRFVPARRGDTPVESWVDVPIIFRLES
ncbi:energy transducer TonB [Sulfuricaulis limicola]|uniref:energy transducer TonB n=1 Tax=Sulfuricaulis limicola TaxID=1620215 RepID=UPI0018D564CC|nr:energy transducer TonB [Sulfuricaulis limicola]